MTDDPFSAVRAAVNAGILRVERIEPPYTDRERQLRTALDLLQREYAERARPILDELVALRSMQPIQYVLITDKDESR